MALGPGPRVAIDFCAWTREEERRGIPSGQGRRPGPVPSTIMYHGEEPIEAEPR